MSRAKKKKNDKNKKNTFGISFSNYSEKPKFRRVNVCFVYGKKKTNELYDTPRRALRDINSATYSYIYNTYIEFYSKRSAPPVETQYFILYTLLVLLETVGINGEQRPTCWSTVERTDDLYVREN